MCRNSRAPEHGFAHHPAVQEEGAPCVLAARLDAGQLRGGGRPELSSGGMYVRHLVLGEEAGHPDGTGGLGEQRINALVLLHAG